MFFTILRYVIAALFAVAATFVALVAMAVLLSQLLEDTTGVMSVVALCGQVALLVATFIGAFAACLRWYGPRKLSQRSADHPAEAVKNP